MFLPPPFPATLSRLMLVMQHQSVLFLEVKIMIKELQTAYDLLHQIHMLPIHMQQNKMVDKVETDTTMLMKATEVLVALEKYNNNLQTGTKHGNDR